MSDKKTNRLPYGIHTALVTPFTYGGVDEDGFARLLGIQGESGVAGAVVACGLWCLAALAPEFRRGREAAGPNAEQGGKEAAEA